MPGERPEVLTAPPARQSRPASATEAAASSPPLIQRGFADVLAEVAGVGDVPLDSHFFDDLGADSMVMARFCARVRKRTDLPSVSIKDVYQNPTIRSLAAATGSIAIPAAGRPPTSNTSADSGADAGTDAGPAAAPVEHGTQDTMPATSPAAGISTRRRSIEYIGCAALQLIAFLCYACGTVVIAVSGGEWISSAATLDGQYLRAVLFGSALFTAMCLVPIIAKWLLVGRWKPQEIRVWSLAYFRFWLVKTLVRMNPLVLLFAGSPIMTLYLRALGARIGPGVVILSRGVPACPDLLTVGAGTIVAKDAVLTCYHARSGVIRTGRVTLGRDVTVCEATVIDIDTSMGDGAQLGHRSSLYSGQQVPAGERWHGSPARPTQVDYRRVEPRDTSTRRRAVYSVLQLVNATLVTLPLSVGGTGLLFAALPGIAGFLSPGALDWTSWTPYRDALVGSSVLLFGTLGIALLFVTTVPRALALAVRADHVYRLYTFAYSVHRGILRVTNSRSLTKLFGDSSYIVSYLSWVGYRLAPVQQTGSNFGSVVRHESPYLSVVGSGTMVADGLSIMNAEYSSTSFRVSRTTIGARNFLGNNVAYPSGGRTGDNVLLATKVQVPIDGEVRENVGLLGSPSFEIPRTVYRDAAIAPLRTRREFRRRLAAKNRHNRRTIAIFLLSRWVDLYVVTLAALAGAGLYEHLGPWGIAFGSVLGFAFHVFYAALAERATTGFRPQEPLACSIHDPAFWRHERFWKLSARPDFFNGTPFKSVLWRLLGVRIGRRVFDDGCGMPERTMVTIGDGCTLNLGSTIQCHSQEDGGFKSDRITIGAGTTLGVGAWVHYGVTIGDGAEIATDSFLMKGEDVPAQSIWGGNPAVELRSHPTGRREPLAVDARDRRLAATDPLPFAPAGQPHPDRSSAQLCGVGSAPRHG